MCSHRLESIGGDENFFDQRMGPNGFTNKGPRRFTAADLGGLIEYLRQNKVLDLFTMPMQWNNQDNGNNWVSHQVKGHGGNMRANIFLGCCPNAKGSGSLLATKCKYNDIPKTTGEEMAGAKLRTSPSSLH